VIDAAALKARQCWRGVADRHRMSPLPRLARLSACVGRSLVRWRKRLCPQRVRPALYSLFAARIAERDTSLVIESERCAIFMTRRPLDGLARWAAATSDLDPESSDPSRTLTRRGHPSRLVVGGGSEMTAARAAPLVLP
jgi:hypothetical protein